MALLIANAAGPDKVSKSFLSFSSNSLLFVFLFRQWITPIHSSETINGEHKTEYVVKFVLLSKSK